ncbi:MAG: UDP-glucose 4-epimerase GalE [Candidatus Melainabacteria bacterium]|nr:UDP-glucose 4-epimerase GalE [Candidatus Melainabacteria bacterium]
MKSKILVTGAAGYIGSIASEMLLEEGYEVLAVDDLSTGHMEAIPPNIPFFNTNIGNTASVEKIFKENKIDIVLHFAGAALVEESMRDPLKYFDINFCQAQNLLDVMIRFNVKKIVFSSTCATYGIPKPDDIPIKEETQTKPINPYGESKLAFEKALAWYKQNHNLDYIALRYFNVAGASKKHGENHNPETHLIPLVIRAANNKNYELSVYGNDYPTKDGTAIRDYIHVADLIHAHIRALEILITNKKHEIIYNIGYGHGYSVLEIVNSAKEVLKKDIQYKLCKRRPGDPPVLIADSSKIRKDLNWQPKHDDIREIIMSASNFIK